MDALLQKFVLFPEYADPRTREYPIPDSILPIIILLAVYLWLALKGGPRFMKNREPFQLKAVLKMYNLFQIVFNAYLTFHLLYFARNFNATCNEMIVSNEYPHNIYMRLAYLYFVNKVVDLLDTAFIVLRKRFRQITGLHLYHHSVMVFGTYLVVRFLPGGHNYFIVVFNAAVHTVMYTYYFLTTIRKTQTLWWKKYITLMQLAQFSIGGIFFVLCYLDPTCSFNKSYVLFMLCLDGIWVYLFANFYYHAYIKKHQ